MSFVAYFYISDSLLRGCSLHIKLAKDASQLQTTTVLNQIYSMSPDTWEHFIEEWMTHFDVGVYYDFERLGGAGDQGRDIVGYVSNPVNDPKYIWDNFQCKHYAKPLAPSDIWVEVGKICYFSYLNEYPFPRKYYFIAPRGVGTRLSGLLKKPNTLKSALYLNWDKYCKKGITSTKDVILDDGLKSYINGLDFAAFDKIATIKIIQGHSKTQFHVDRFNTALPPRPKTPQVSTTVGQHELNYVTKLVHAYDSHCKDHILSINNLIEFPSYESHLKRAREDFLHAETLRNFSRDTLPDGEFESIQDQVLSGVIDIVEDKHQDGFTKVKEVVKESRRLQLPKNLLSTCLTINDRGGICHQLSNSNKISWCEHDD